MKRILSGIKPTGRLHLGNYFGMMRPAIEWQEKGDAFYFIADYHALTTMRDAGALRQHSLDVALDFIACGLDPERAVLFRQSDVPEVTELAWILSCVTPVALLERCHAYKDALARGQAPNHGLFTYPLLMAADILIYDSDVVPVGRDQKQHIEIARDAAVRLNQAFGEVLKLPEPSILPDAAIVPGLDGQKMSKSYGNTIPLFSGEKQLRKKIMSIVTDSTPVEEPKDPMGSTIVEFYRLVASQEEVAAMEADFRSGGHGYGEFKQRLFEKVRAFFGPMHKRREALESDFGAVEAVLKKNAERARHEARLTLRRVRNATGL